ncbi:MAG: thymidylate kinase [Armatimonadia bacterium]|nr:thymidylate kinase [Armatimonadia bacterium]
MPEGKIVAFEGIDGSGKGTQAQALADRAAAHGLSVACFAFPRYSGSFYGELCVRYLRGEFGAIGDQSPYLSALPYAGDRLEAAPLIEAARRSHELVVIDRYVGSNAAHQGAKLSLDAFSHFAEWIARLEYEVHGIPAEDAVVMLDIPVETAAGLMAARRRDSGRVDDIHERDLEYLAEVRIRYQWMAANWAGWWSIACDEMDALRPPEGIAADIAAHLSGVLALPLAD